MVNNFQWNILETEMLKIIHENIINILKGTPNNNIKLNELIKILNLKTNHLSIHNNKKYNSTSKYIKYQYNGITKFLDTYNIYGISNFKNYTYVHLIDLNCSENNIHKRITNENDWIFI